MAGDSKPERGPTPFLLAILLCDNVITDEITKKKSLIGVFDQVLAGTFPLDRKLQIYARMTDGEGSYTFRIDYVQVKTDKVLTQGQMPGVTFESRFSIVELILDPPPVPIPEAGQYEFSIWANDRYVGRTRFTAKQLSVRGA